MSWTIVLGCIIIFFLGIYAVFIIKQLLAWKAPVESSLKELEQYKLQYLTLTPAAIILTQDSNISIEKWDGIKGADIHDTHLILKTYEPVFLFPAKTMQPDEYSKLKDFILNKIKTEPVTPVTPV